MDDTTEPVLNENGRPKEFIVKIGGIMFSCKCGCNVFHKPDKDKLDLYECNACGNRFLGD